LKTLKDCFVVQKHTNDATKKRVSTFKNNEHRLPNPAIGFENR